MYIKLSKDLEVLPDSESSWEYIKDTNTGLVWEAATMSGSWYSLSKLGLPDVSQLLTLDMKDPMFTGVYWSRVGSGDDCAAAVGPDGVVHMKKHLWQFARVLKHDRWDDFFMSVARTAARLSKDPNAQVGAVIARNKRILSTGFNGMPSGINESQFIGNKNLCTVHAEANAILFCADCRGASLYTTRFPCAQCATLVIQS